MRPNLPVQLTGFVGRKREFAEVRRLLEETRVVCIAGPAGSGKTRLGLEIARMRAEGACFADLSVLTAPGLVVGAVASAAGLEAARVPDLTTLAHQLRQESGVVLLDNCEHLAGEPGSVADVLVHACPQLRVLATSREPLGVQSEAVYRLGGLSESDAMRLFVLRARQADDSFRLDDQDEATVAAICRRLDRLPLAIEMAAAYAGLLAPEDLLGRLHQRFGLLADRRSPVARHKTMRAAIEWSEGQLTAAERTVFRRLGVFVGSFDLEAAEAVVTGSELTVPDSLPILLRLVERSLVQLDRSEGVGRYRLLETLREYAMEMLAEAGELEAVRNAHAGHYWQVTLGRFNELFSDEPTALIDPTVLRDLGNYRAALEFTNAAGSPLFAKLAGRLTSVWGLIPINEACHWMEIALAEGSPDPETRYWLLWNLGLFAGLAGDSSASLAYLDEALALCEARSDSREAARILANMAAVKGMAGEAEASLACAQRAVRLVRETSAAGRRRVLALALMNLAAALLRLSDLDGALVAAEEAVAIADGFGEPQIRRMTRGQQVDVYSQRLELEKAIALHRQALGIGPVDVLRQLEGLARMATLLIATGKIERGFGWLGPSKPTASASTTCQPSATSPMGLSRRSRERLASWARELRTCAPRVAG